MAEPRVQTETERGTSISWDWHAGERTAPAALRCPAPMSISRRAPFCPSCGGRKVSCSGPVGKAKPF